MAEVKVLNILIIYGKEPNFNNKRANTVCFCIESIVN